MKQENKTFKISKADLAELKIQKQKNFEERLKFIDKYVAWLKKTPNKIWSSSQNKLINRPK